MAALDALLLLFVFAALFGVVRYATRGDRALSHTPAAAIRSSDAPFIEQASANWKLARRAVNSLERIVEDDDIWPLLPEKSLISARKVISDFYQQEDS